MIAIMTGRLPAGSPCLPWGPAPTPISAPSVRTWTTCWGSWEARGFSNSRPVTRCADSSKPSSSGLPKCSGSVTLYEKLKWKTIIRWSYSYLALPSTQLVITSRGVWVKYVCWASKRIRLLFFLSERIIFCSRKIKIIKLFYEFNVFSVLQTHRTCSAIVSYHLIILTANH